MVPGASSLYVARSFLGLIEWIKLCPSKRTQIALRVKRCMTGCTHGQVIGGRGFLEKEAKRIVLMAWQLGVRLNSLFRKT